MDEIGSAAEFFISSPWRALVPSLLCAAIYGVLLVLARRNPAVRPWPFLAGSLAWLAWSLYEWLGLGDNFIRADAVIIFSCLVLWTGAAVPLSFRWRALPNGIDQSPQN
jgi:hypothetical protein